MKTQIILPDEEGIAKAGQILRDGGLVAFPTETVYGLGANALDPVATRHIYEAKGRPGDNPMIVHVSNLEMLNGVARGFRFAEGYHVEAVAGSYNVRAAQTSGSSGCYNGRAGYGGSQMAGAQGSVGNY